jgi:type VI secretion system protein ImpH
LFAEPWEFEFFQAVRLLELLRPGNLPPGEGIEADEEVVRFRSVVSHVFPGAEIQALESPKDPGAAPVMTANLFNIGGASGPLPDQDSDLAIERAWRKDYAMRDFLDIFHHRLLSLLVKTRKAHHPAFTPLAPDQGPVAQYLYALFGLAPSSLQGRMQVPDRSFIFYSGILSQHPRSASGLERLLADYFGTPVQVLQLIGQWRQLEPEEWTRLGVTGKNQTLGGGAMVGTRIWDQQGHFEVNLGPMKLPMLRDFLPTGGGYTPLCELTRFYVGPEFDFSFRLKLGAEEVPESRLGQSRLGWTSWLKTRRFDHDDSQMRLMPRAPADPFSGPAMRASVC